MPDSLQQALAAEAAKLLENGRVNLVLGFANKSDGPARPLFAKTAEEAGQLVWHSGCTPHLAAYLSALPGKTAITAKPCDIRSLVVMLGEHRIKREDVFIIALPCTGMQAEDGTLLPGCRLCGDKTFPLHDLILAEEAPWPAPPIGEATPAEDTPDFARFAKELEKCTLCYSCRQACPGCSCEVCFMDRQSPAWQAATPGFSDKMLFHLGRSMHLAGRCTACGACQNACAFGVDLSFLRAATEQFIAQEYGFTAGLDPAATPAMLAHAPNDTETGFYGGGRHEE